MSYFADMDAFEAPDSRHLLFTYGTLMLTTGIAAVDEAMRKAGKSLGRGFIHGRLYDFGDYPGAVAAGRYGTGEGSDGAGSEDAPKVWGHLLLLDDPDALFSVLDPYEGFTPADLTGSEFVRALAAVTLPDKSASLEAQIYYYNFSIAGRAPIASGDYLAHWSAQGKPLQGRTRE